MKTKIFLISALSITISISHAQDVFIRKNNNGDPRIELKSPEGNTFIGDSSGVSMTNGYFNTAIGHKSLIFNTSGYDNAAIGAFSLYKNTSGYYNSAFGGASLYSNTVGHHNVSVGLQTLYENIDGDDNTVVGAVAMYYNLHGDRNTAVGRATLQNCTNNDNTAIGYRTMFYSTSGYRNTAVGIQAMEYNTTGINNVAIGAYALNIANDSFNVAVGFDALRFNTTGTQNVSVGHQALFANAVGNQNTAVGNYACFGCTGFGNVALGASSLFQNQQGSLNTAMGYGSGLDSTYDNIIGINNWNSLVENNNYVHIGNLLHVWNGGNVPWSTFSDARIKTDIREDVKGLDFILRLRPVTYHRNIDAQEELNGTTNRIDLPHRYEIEEIKFSGFLAQEVESAAQASGYDFSGLTKPKNQNAVYTLSYESFVVPLVKALQEQQQMIEAMQAEIDGLKKELNTNLTKR